MVVADGRILENFSLKVNESSLTGESEGCEKTDDVIAQEKVALGDQKNMVFSGSLVTYGRATVLVTGTGMETELGKIASLMNRTQQRKTPCRRAWTSSARSWPPSSWSSAPWCFAPVLPAVPMGLLDSTDVCCGSGGGRYSRGAVLHCHHRVGDGDPKNGPSRTRL